MGAIMMIGGRWIVKEDEVGNADPLAGWQGFQGGPYLFLLIREGPAISHSFLHTQSKRLVELKKQVNDPCGTKYQYQKFCHI